MRVFLRVFVWSSEMPEDKNFKVYKKLCHPPYYLRGSGFGFRCKHLYSSTYNDRWSILPPIQACFLHHPLEWVPGPYLFCYKDLFGFVWLLWRNKCFSAMTTRRDSVTCCTYFFFPEVLLWRRDEPGGTDDKSTFRIKCPGECFHLKPTPVDGSSVGLHSVLLRLTDDMISVWPLAGHKKLLCHGTRSCFAFSC